MNLKPPDISLAFGELSLNEGNDEIRAKYNQGKSKPDFNNPIKSNDKSNNKRNREHKVKQQYKLKPQFPIIKSKYKSIENRAAKPDELETKTRQNLKSSLLESSDVRIRPTENKKSMSTLKSSKFSSLNNNKSFGTQFDTSKVVTTFKSNIYASLGSHKKVASSTAEKVKPPTNNISSRENIEVHDRWASYSKTKNPSLVVANSKNKDSEVFDFKHNPDEESAGNVLLNNLANQGEQDFEEDEVNPEDCIVDGLTVPLLPHQVSGLRFLMRREAMKGSSLGGLLCDDMGLGKTIQTIAMILKNKGNNENKTNLIVCPVALTNQWKSEIESKTSGLSILIFHGPDRPKNYEELAKYDVVITTYATVSSEFHKNGSPSPLYSSEFKWWRIILDEAHQIKNKNSKQALAVFNLVTDRRWCLTGTPLQNNLSELQSLFKFIRVSKYGDDRIWLETIQQYIQEHDMYSALFELRDELSKLMLRRTKAILSSSHNTFKLPPKNVHHVMIEFTEFERSIYDNVKDIILSNLNNQPIINKKMEVIRNNAPKLQLKKRIAQNQNGNINYMSALVYLLRLRQLCCSWNLLFEGDVNSLDFEEKLTTSNEKATSLDSLIDSMSGLSVSNCEVCMVRLDANNECNDDKRFCKPCGERVKVPKHQGDDYYVSSKIKQVLEILSTNPDRKTIIFSQFPSLFKILGDTLSSRGYKTLTYDGSMDIKARNLALNSLKNDPDSNILLCSLKCGSVGLNLTCASQVILFDPWWNPQIQEQAIDRVYRIGQMKPVDIYEITVKNTVEDNILKLQETKRQLANAVTSNDSKISAKNISNNLTKKELLQLFDIE